MSSIAKGDRFIITQRYHYWYDSQQRYTGHLTEIGDIMVITGEDHYYYYFKEFNGARTMSLPKGRTDLLDRVTDDA